MPAIRRLLIANRGEIALRIVRTARALGIESVVAHSEADAEGLAARLADRAVLLGPAPPAQSYLSVERVVACALQSGCDAVHPGYGFLSEREELARDVERAGLTYVGPTPENVRLLGDKLAARREAVSAGVPVVPGETAALADPQALARVGERVGFPLLLKAASGGGGKGIRLARTAADLEAAWRMASSEARGAFGEGTVFAERYLEEARHVEVQIMGDGRGGARVFPERDCSLQRRYQKLVEETPSPAVDPAVRERLLEMAGRMASISRYRGAGTVEFLLAGDGSFYFLEVNTRLQVEHPITEAVCGVDLVAEQIGVAEGREIGTKKIERVAFKGAAIELRVNSEDPLDAFRPSTGRVHAVRLPAGPGVRVDSALYPGLEVTPYYDPLLAKLITWGADRGQALARMRAACSEMWVAGVATTLPIGVALASQPGFHSGRYHCQTLEGLLAQPDLFTGPPLDEREQAALAIVAAYLRRRHAEKCDAAAPAGSREGGVEAKGPSAWVQAGRLQGLRGGGRPDAGRAVPGPRGPWSASGRRGEAP